MKNNLKIILVLSITAIFSIAISNAQCLQYTIGTQSAYAMNSSGDSLITLQVTLTSSGVATVARSTIAYSTGTEPNPMTHILGPSSDWIITTSLNDPIELELVSSLSGEQYYLIGFENPTDYRAFGNGGDKVIIECKCKRGDGDCSVSSTTSNGSTCVTCVAEAGCSKCKQTQTKQSTSVIEGSSLIVRASSLIIQ